MGCAKGAEKASCGETVVQHVKMDSTIFSISSKVVMYFKSKPQGGGEENGLTETPFWTTVSPHVAFSAPLARSD